MTKTAAKHEPNPEAPFMVAGLSLQEEGLRLLLAEIQALQAMLPTEAHKTPSDAEVEEGFDNMPV